MDSLHNCFIKLIVSITLFRSHSKWKRIMCKKVLIKWLNAKPVLLGKYWWAVYILIGIRISPVVIYKSLNKHTNRELIYNFSPSPKSNFLFKFSFTKVGVWSKKSLIDNGVAVTYSNIRGKSLSLPVCFVLENHSKSGMAVVVTKIAPFVDQVHFSFWVCGLQWQHELLLVNLVGTRVARPPVWQGWTEDMWWCVPNSDAFISTTIPQSEKGGAFWSEYDFPVYFPHCNSDQGFSLE